jgi:zinc protease
MSADLSTEIISNSGAGSYDQSQLEKYLSDKVVSAGPGISELQETMDGSTSPKDLETMMQLIYLYFTAPRKDSIGFRSTMAQELSFLQNQHSSPESALRDTIQSVMNGHNYRYQPVDETMLKQTDLNRAFQVYKERFSNADGWTFVFTGNFKPEELKPLVEMYLGGIPSITKKKRIRI